MNNSEESKVAAPGDACGGEISEAADEAPIVEEPSAEAADAPVNRMSKRKRRGIVAGVVVAVVALAAAGLMVWHEQPSFCAAICHDPMDSYLPTYEATPGEAGTDKWGNEVADSSSMLAAVHGQVGKTCLDCHVPQLSEQTSEGLEWVSGNYDSTLGERTLTQLVEARDLDSSDEFCMNDTCHTFTRDDLQKKTEWMGVVNPHSDRHGEQ